MSRIKKYSGFINENMDQAKSLIAKKMAAFDKLKNLLSKNLGYIGKFTEYLMHENIKYEDLVELYNQILDLKSKNATIDISKLSLCRKVSQSPLCELSSISFCIACANFSTLLCI